MSDASPPSGPGATDQALTPAQLRHILALRFPGPGGRLDAHAAAAGLGVSERTIRRWTSNTTTTGSTESQVQRRIGTCSRQPWFCRMRRTGLTWLKRDRSRVPVLWRSPSQLKAPIRRATTPELPPVRTSNNDPQAP